MYISSVSPSKPSFSNTNEFAQGMYTVATTPDPFAEANSPGAADHVQMGKRRTAAQKAADEALKVANAARRAAASAAQNQPLVAPVAASSAPVAGPVNQAPTVAPLAPAASTASAAGPVNPASNAASSASAAASSKPAPAKKDKVIDYVAAAIHCKTCANLGYDCLFPVSGRRLLSAGDLTRDRSVAERVLPISGVTPPRLVIFLCKFGDRSFYPADRPQCHHLPSCLRRVYTIHQRRRSFYSVWSPPGLHRSPLTLFSQPSSSRHYDPTGQQPRQGTR